MVIITVNGYSENGYTDSAFQGAGQKFGLEIWKVQDGKVEPRKAHGIFDVNSAYIVLHTENVSKAVLTNWQLHYWLGENCSKEDRKLVEKLSLHLGDSLDGLPTEYRESQGHESKQFLSYFKQGIRYFNADNDENVTEANRLYLIKGKRHCRVTQVPAEASSLNKGDVFVLDTPGHIYVWMGPDSNDNERFKGVQIGEQIRDVEHDRKSIIHLIDTDWHTNEPFFNKLGCDTEVYIKSEKDGGDDEMHETRQNEEERLFRVWDVRGTTMITEIEDFPLHQKLLKSNECYILDMGFSGGIIAWTGCNTCATDRQSIWRMSAEFLKRRKYSPSMQVIRLHEGAESILFQHKFNFYDLNMIDEHNCVKHEEFMPDNGKGSLKIWRVQNHFYHVPIDQKQYGTFYSDDCYLLLYSYQDSDGRPQPIIYTWEGMRSSYEERLSAASCAAKMDEKEHRSKAIQIRVLEGREPEHFLKIFKERNKMVTMMGGHRTDYRKLNEFGNYDGDKIRLFHVRNHRVMQVPEKAESLCSDDIFVLETPYKTFLWHGKGASYEEKTVSTDFAKMVVIPLRTPIVIEEENETEEFWAYLGGKAKYETSIGEYNVWSHQPARLFHCSNASGAFKVEELLNFSQQDLNEDDVMLLDAGTEIYVWIGQGANVEEKFKATTTAMEYVRTDPLCRSISQIATITIKQGREPESFRQRFQHWESTFWDTRDTYENIKGRIQQENHRIQLQTQVEEKLCKTYPIEVLRQRNDLPDGINETQREMHLSDDDFLNAFRMTKKEFTQLAEWKKRNLKKDIGLF